MYIVDRIFLRPYKRLKQWWWSMRHVNYSSTIIAPPPSGADDTANIQAAINRASHNQDYIDALKLYRAYRVKWLHRKPVQKSTTQFQYGTYNIGKNINIVGTSKENTVITVKDKS